MVTIKVTSARNMVIQIYTFPTGTYLLRGKKVVVEEIVLITPA